MSSAMTIRLDDEVRDRLEQLASATQRSKSFLAAEAIRNFVEANEWQIGQIQAAIKEAEAGDFASDEDVAAVAAKWQLGAEKLNAGQMAAHGAAHRHERPQGRTVGGAEDALHLPLPRTGADG